MNSEKNEPVLIFDAVSKWYKDDLALKEVSLTVLPGTVLALLGENGAGKTTAIKLMLGLLQPDEGTVHVLGMSPRTNDLQIRKRCGYVPEQPALYDYMTVEETGRFASAFYSNSYWGEYCRLAESFGLPMKSKIRNLSKGMKAEVSLALALASDPELLVLDEPTSGLDAMIRRRFMESMVDRAAVGKTVFLSSHQITEVERVADTIAIIRKSRLLLVEPLSQLKETTGIFVVTFSDHPPQDTNWSAKYFEELVQEEQQGRQSYLLGRRPVANALEHIAALPGVTHVEEKKPSLEDIFLGYMKDR